MLRTVLEHIYQVDQTDAWLVIFDYQIGNDRTDRFHNCAWNVTEVCNC